MKVDKLGKKCFKVQQIQCEDMGRQGVGERA